MANVNRQRKIFLAVAVVAGIVAATSLILNHWTELGGAQKTRLGYVATGINGFVVSVMQREGLISTTESGRLETDDGQIEFVGYPGPPLLNGALVGGDIHASLGTSSAVVANAQLSGRNIVYIQALLYNTNAIIARSDREYSGLDDLKSKKIGWFGANTGGGVGLFTVSSKTRPGLFQTLDLRDYKPPQLPRALESDEVDAILIFEPFVSRLISQDEYEIVYGPLTDEWFQQTGLKLELAGFAGDTEWAKNNRQLVGQISTLWRDAVRMILQDPEHHVRAHADMLGLQNDEQIVVAIDRIPATLVDDATGMNRSIIEMLEAMVDNNYMLTDIRYDIFLEK